MAILVALQRQKREFVAGVCTIIAWLSVLLLSACTYVKPYKPLVKGSTTAQPAATTKPVTNGSIYQNTQPNYYSYYPLFEDPRPRNIGDIITIRLEESATASKESSAKAAHEAGGNFGLTTSPDLFGAKNSSANITGKNTFNGSGGASAKNDFTGTITVTVDQVLPNGNLHVVGEKQIAINQGTEFIRFSGVVNPRMIDGSNSISSTVVSDARIEYVGEGYINEAQNMHWLQRFFLNVLPY